MIPNHHPHPETLIAYAAGTLPSAIACIIACHRSMCSECAKHIRWLEMLGGVMLADLETNPEEPTVAEPADQSRPARQCSHRPEHKPATNINANAQLLPFPLSRYLDANDAEISCQPVAGNERRLELGADSGSIKLLRLEPGQLLPDYDASSENQVALVLEGACRNGAGTYIRGDIIEWTQDRTHRPMVASEAECICLMADQAFVSAC